MFSAPFSCTIIIIIVFCGGGEGGEDKNKVYYGQYERGDCNLVITQKVLMLV